MVSTHFGLQLEPPQENSNPLWTTTMMNNNVLYQLQTLITKMEHHYEEELRKLKADHKELEAHVRCSKETNILPT